MTVTLKYCCDCCYIIIKNEYMNNTNDAAGRLVFMLGTTPNTRLLEEVGQESAEHGDIVQGDLLDTYRNLTYKSVMGHLWVR